MTLEIWFFLRLSDIEKKEHDIAEKSFHRAYYSYKRLYSRLFTIRYNVNTNASIITLWI